MADTDTVGVMSTIPNINLSEQAVDFMSAEKCFRAQVAFSLLGKAREKFVPIHFSESIAEAEPSALNRGLVK
jgi:hypothetical protein